MALIAASGLKHLLDGVRAYFAANGVTALVEVGAKKLPQQSQGTGGANRVVFVPFDPKSGAAGQFVEPGNFGFRDIDDDSDPPVHVGAVRPIADWQRQMVVSVWARDATKPEDEEAQAIAVEDLVERTMQAIVAVGLADVGFSKIEANVPKERVFGSEVRFGLTFTQPIFDRPLDVGHPEFATVKKKTEE